MEVIKPTIVLDEWRLEYLVILPPEPSIDGVFEESALPERRLTAMAVYGYPQYANRHGGDKAVVYRFLGVRIK